MIVITDGNSVILKKLVDRTAEIKVAQIKIHCYIIIIN